MKLTYVYTLLLTLIVLSTSSAQNFEGILNMHQVTANGIEYDIKWYVKDQRIAFEISTEAARGTWIRFVPNKETKTMLMVVGDKERRDIPLTDLLSEFNVDGLEFEMSDGEPVEDFKKVKNIEVSSNTSKSTIHVTTEIDINFSDYVDFFKNDYGIYVLASTGKAGFPIYNLTQDKYGNMITKTELVDVQRTKIDDAIFQ